MVQPVRRGISKSTPPLKKKPQSKGKRCHPKYGTSKLEDKFATEFLDRIGVRYVRQYEAKDIKRFYDFFILPDGPLIEVDGDYYHSYGLTREEKNPMQKKNERVDRLKDEWALSHCIPIVRFWEHDINNNPQKVLSELKEAVGKRAKQIEIEEEKKKRH